jgi:rod shape determining protein RodA
MISSRTLRQFDFSLLGITLALAMVGVLGVYSASLNGNEATLYLKQLLRVGFGLGVCLAAVFFGYHQLVDRAYTFYALSLLVLVGVLIFGTEINGSKSWISFGGWNLQPSEFTKIVIILALTRYLAEGSRTDLSGRQILGLVALCTPPVVLIILQRDLGTAVTYAPILVGIMLVAGVRPKVLIGLSLVVILLAPVGWLGLKDYQRQRVLVTFDPELDPQGIGYQTRQSQIAIGSGGLYGRGLGNGLQSQLGFVPESHTDLIFALLAEETGFFGATCILLLYLAMISRLVFLDEKARDRAGILIIAGVLSMVFSHVVINVGMALGIAPAIGIPLPLLSYGGSSTLTTFVAIGLALNVGLRRFVYS